MHRINSSAILLAAAGIAAQSFAADPAALRISHETAPAGGWAQIKVYAASPTAIQSGRVVFDLDPTVFGPDAVAGVFGANADAAGVAAVDGSKIDVRFSSATGGMGQLAALPVIVISAPVLATAGGRTVAIAASSSDGSASIAEGSLTVKGTLSVRRIPAGLGTAAAGTVVAVSGQGFSPSTTVSIDGVAIAATRFVSPQRIEVTLGGAAELVGKRARVSDGGETVDYFCFEPNERVQPAKDSSFGPGVAQAQPLFPVFASAALATDFGYIGGVVAVENPNPDHARVTVTTVNSLSGAQQSQETRSIPPGGWTTFDGAARSSSFIAAGAPVRAVGMEFCDPGVGTPACFRAAVPYDAAKARSRPVVMPPSVSFVWRKGSPFPEARTVSLSPDIASFAATASVTGSGMSWLSVATAARNTFTVSVNPSGLDNGAYDGWIDIQPPYGLLPARVPVSLTVTGAPAPSIAAAPASLAFPVPALNAEPVAQTVEITSDSGPSAFSVALAAESWVKVSPMYGTTPATLTVTWDPAVTARFPYRQRSVPATILISGPANAVSIPATFNVTGVQTYPTYLLETGTGPQGLIFSAQTGSAAQTQTFSVDPAGGISAVTDRQWLRAAPDGDGQVAVTADPSGLPDGVYRGTVTVAEPGLASKAVPVTLGVWSVAPQVTVSPAAFHFLGVVGEPAPFSQTGLADSGGVPVPVSLTSGSSWLHPSILGNALVPAPIRVDLSNPPSQPGQYDSSFTVRSQGSGPAASVPVTLVVEPGPFARPTLAHAVNAASGLAGSVSPGEILTIRGYASGSPRPGAMEIDAPGSVATSLNGLRVAFDGVPAPLLYTSANQTNVIVPYEAAGKAVTTMQATYEASRGTLKTAAWDLPVAAAAPAIFTLDSTGVGQAAAVNQDGAINGADAPAPRGSIVSIYATGEGQTSPAGVTGSIAQSDVRKPLLPVTATIGGVDAEVQYAGSAPGQVAGLMQVNLVVPQGVAPGAAAVILKVGELASQAGVTVAVR